MKNKLPLIICMLLLLPLCLQAQKRVTRLDYDKYSKEVREEVWKWKQPAFNNTNVPDKYNDASGIVIAQHHELELSAKNRFNWAGTNNDLTTGILFVKHTLRKRIKLNDKSSIEKYSELSFQEFIANQQYKFIATAAAMTVVGVRIIKPDGTVKELDASEEVKLEGTRTDRSRKLAIADLQVGDIIDYFIHTVAHMEHRNVDPFSFVLAESNPILSYSIHAVIDKKLTAEYRSINGAPEFSVVKNKKSGDFELSINSENSAPIANEQWISPGRQMPLVSLAVYYNSNKRIYHPPSARKAGVHKNVDPEQIINDYKWYIYIYGTNYRVTTDNYFRQIDNIVKKYKAANPKAPNDSLACLLYHAMQHFYLNDWETERVEVGNSRNFYKASHFRFIARFGKILMYYNIKTNIVFTPSAYGASLNNINDINDLEAFVATQSDHPVLFVTPTVFSEANVVPGAYEGQKAVLFNAGKLAKGDFKAKNRNTTISTPLSTAAQNKRTDDIKVCIDMANPLDLQFDRTAHASGHLKEAPQRMLLLYEDYEALNREAFAVGKSMFDEMADKRKTRALVQEYEAAFAKAREEQQDAFKEEVKLMHDQDSKEVKSFEILSAGMPVQRKEFEYKVQYVMDGYVRKAGNNYTIDIGKLAGTQLRLEPKERTRNMDVYMSCARTYEVNLSVEIPHGYSVEGINALQQNVSNACGKFTVTASVDNNVLKLHVVKEYSHAFEPAANWPQLLEILDGANDFFNKNIMLRKRG